MLQIQPFSMVCLALGSFCFIFHRFFSFFSLFLLSSFILFEKISSFLFFPRFHLLLSNPLYPIVCSLWQQVHIKKWKTKRREKSFIFELQSKSKLFLRMHRCSDNTTASNLKANTLTGRSTTSICSHGKFIREEILMFNSIEAIWQNICAWQFIGKCHDNDPACCLSHRQLRFAENWIQFIFTNAQRPKLNPFEWFALSAQANDQMINCDAVGKHSIHKISTQISIQMPVHTFKFVNETNHNLNTKHSDHNFQT